MSLDPLGGGMKTRRSDADLYLKQYPDLNRWLNQCPSCGARGYKPELPDNIYPHFNVAADNLRKFFRPLAINELGLCEQCARAIEVSSEALSNPK
jgi:hypothetical protein